MKRKFSREFRMPTLAAKKAPKRPSTEIAPVDVARALLRDVQEEYLRLLREKPALDGVLARWERLMTDYRQFQRSCMVTPTRAPENVESHHNLLNLMILCAGCIVTACERHFEEHRDLAKDILPPPTPETDLVRCDKEVLEFEIRCWHGPTPTKEQLELAERVLCVPSPKAA